MKNILKLGALAVTLLIAGSAFGLGRCNTGCRTRCEVTSCAPCQPACKLPPPQRTEVQYATTCQGTPEYHWECRKVYHPCNDKVTERKVCVQERCVGVKVEGEEMPYTSGSFVEKQYAPVKKQRLYRNGY